MFDVNNKFDRILSVIEIITITILALILIYDLSVLSDINKKISDLSNQIELNNRYTNNDTSRISSNTPKASIEDISSDMSFTTYSVKEGDTLWGIAKKFYNDGEKYLDIMMTNNMKSDFLRIGQKIILPTIPTVISNTDSNKTSDLDYESTNETMAKDEMTFVGNFKITGYDPYCSHCCGGHNHGITASGKQATFNHTVATNKEFSFGTKLYIEGYGVYVVEDRGVGHGVIDVAVESHSAAYNITKDNVAVYVIN